MYLLICEKKQQFQDLFSIRKGRWSSEATDQIANFSCYLSFRYRGAHSTKRVSLNSSWNPWPWTVTESIQCHTTLSSKHSPSLSTPEIPAVFARVALNRMLLVSRTSPRKIRLRTRYRNQKVRILIKHDCSVLYRIVIGCNLVLSKWAFPCAWRRVGLFTIASLPVKWFSRSSVIVSVTSRSASAWTKSCEDFLNCRVQPFDPMKNSSDISHSGKLKSLWQVTRDEWFIQSANVCLTFPKLSCLVRKEVSSCLSVLIFVLFHVLHSWIASKCHRVWSWSIEVYSGGVCAGHGICRCDERLTNDCMNAMFYVIQNRLCAEWGRRKPLLFPLGSRVPLNFVLVPNILLACFTPCMAMVYHLHGNGLSVHLFLLKFCAAYLKWPDN